MKHSTRSILVALVGLLLAASCGRPERAGPNVLLLVMDTTRADRCSVDGYDLPTTPAVAAVAAEGTVYRKAWSPSPWTGPAHASLFTGRRPEHHRFLSGRMRDFLAETPTLASWFREAGYATACFSNSTYVSREFGLAQGFDRENRDFENPDRPYPYAPATHRAALEWAKRCREDGRPFFLFVNDYEPHYPYEPPADFEKGIVPDSVTAADRAWARSLPHYALAGHMLRATPLSAGSIRVLSSLYDAEIACLDQAIGELVRGLRDLGVLDDTVLVITADHGECFGEHDVVEHLATLDRAVLHVPLVVRYPRRFAAGRAVDDLVRLEDLAPTLLETCGLPVPAGLDGESLLGSTGGRIARATYLPLISAMANMREQFPRQFDASHMEREIRSAFDGRWHYVLYSDGEERLFDLSADPRETTNLAPDRPEEIRRLAELLPVLPPAEADVERPGR